jgi:hypothetical protein
LLNPDAGIDEKYGHGPQMGADAGMMKRSIQRQSKSPFWLSATSAPYEHRRSVSVFAVTP